jgi:hypothetical protein
VQDDDAVVALVDLSGLRRNERTRVGEETRQGWRDRWMGRNGTTTGIDPIMHERTNERTNERRTRERSIDPSLER